MVSYSTNAVHWRYVTDQYNNERVSEVYFSPLWGGGTRITYTFNRVANRVTSTSFIFNRFTFTYNTVTYTSNSISSVTSIYTFVTSK